MFLVVFEVISLKVTFRVDLLGTWRLCKKRCCTLKVPKRLENFMTKSARLLMLGMKVLLFTLATLLHLLGMDTLVQPLEISTLHMSSLVERSCQLCWNRVLRKKPCETHPILEASGIIGTLHMVSFPYHFPILLGPLDWKWFLWKSWGFFVFPQVFSTENVAAEVQLEARCGLPRWHTNPGGLCAYSQLWLDQFTWHLQRGKRGKCTACTWTRKMLIIKCKKKSIEIVWAMFEQCCWFEQV